MKRSRKISLIVITCLVIGATVGSCVIDFDLPELGVVQDAGSLAFVPDFHVWARLQAR